MGRTDPKPLLFLMSKHGITPFPLFLKDNRPASRFSLPAEIMPGEREAGDPLGMSLTSGAAVAKAMPAKGQWRSRTAGPVPRPRAGGYVVWRGEGTWSMSRLTVTLARDRCALREVWRTSGSGVPAPIIICSMA